MDCRLTKNDLNGFPVSSLEESSGRDDGGWYWSVDGIAYRSDQETDTDGGQTEVAGSASTGARDLGCSL